MGRPSNEYKPGVYAVDLKKPRGEVLSLTHRADSVASILISGVDEWIETCAFAGESTSSPAITATGHFLCRYLAGYLSTPNR